MSGEFEPPTQSWGFEGPGEGDPSDGDFDPIAGVPVFRPGRPVDGTMTHEEIIDADPGGIMRCND